MAALTGDVPALEGSVGVTGYSSTVRAAVAFYPPSDFLSMDGWAVRKCVPSSPGGPALTEVPCHDERDSPESQLVGCAIQSCPDKVRAADPARYVTAGDPPVMIMLGGSDRLVPHNQGERLYMTLNKACTDALFISLPKAGHGPMTGFLADDALREGSTMRSTAAAGCVVSNPAPFTPSWQTVIDFFDKHLRP